MANPFRASFGVSPPLLVGRDAVIEEFMEAIEDGPGATGRATLYTGARGSGKTVMLNAIEDRTRERGWLVISETASAGFVGRITNHLPRLLRQLDPKPVSRKLTGITAPLSLGGVTWDSTENHASEEGLRSRVEQATDVLLQHETGLLITLDEIHQSQIGELREFATVVQHAFREGRELAFAGAGLASSVSDIVNDDILTFLRRADRRSLGSVSHEDVERALREPIAAAGRTVSGDALRLMAAGTGGYPFLIQLVGVRTWRLHPAVTEISPADAAQGVADARRRLGALVHEPALTSASDIDKSFLLAMAKDDGPSRMLDVQRRMGVDVNYASQYRLRLIAAELIVSTRHGFVDFAIPYLREYLREHAAAQA